MGKILLNLVTHGPGAKDLALFLQLEVLQRFALHAFLPSIEAELQTFGFFFLHHRQHRQFAGGLAHDLVEHQGCAQAILKADSTILAQEEGKSSQKFDGSVNLISCICLACLCIFGAPKIHRNQLPESIFKSSSWAWDRVQAKNAKPARNGCGKERISSSSLQFRKQTSSRSSRRILQIPFSLQEKKLPGGESCRCFFNRYFVKQN